MRHRCVAVHTCQAGKQTPPSAQATYTSPFDSWYERSSVRSAPQRLLSRLDAAESMFARALTPLLRSEAFLTSVDGAGRLATIQQALRYLRGTALLETRVVNDVVLNVAENGMGLHLPASMRLDAYRIYTDEAYHAQFSVELASQIVDVTGVKAVESGAPTFYSSLLALEARTDPDYRRLLRLLFVVCSETLITGSLSVASTDPAVSGPVRQALRDHASDEGRHHTYFSALLRLLWEQLDFPARRFSAWVIPELISIFCMPDFRSISAELATYGIDADDASSIVDDVFPAELLQANATTSARHLLKLLADLGISDFDKEVHDRYEDFVFTRTADSTRGKGRSGRGHRDI